MRDSVESYSPYHYPFGSGGFPVGMTDVRGEVTAAIAIDAVTDDLSRNTTCANNNSGSKILSSEDAENR